MYYALRETQSHETRKRTIATEIPLHRPAHSTSIPPRPPPLDPNLGCHPKRELAIFRNVVRLNVNQKPCQILQAKANQSSRSQPEPSRRRIMAMLCTAIVDELPEMALPHRWM
jgi:hypothetical protein